MKAKFQSLVERVQQDPKKLVYFLVAGFLTFWILRGCFPGLGGRNLPADVMDEIQRSHINCIKVEDTPIWPGETRQPECGHFDVELVASGAVPVSAQQSGVTRAICYKISVENPRWQTMGQTRHELLWTSRTFSKVTILQNGEWQTFPDEDKGDEQRWREFGCPGEYVLE